MMVAVRGEIVDGMIRGDLVGSRVFLAYDVRSGESGWPVVPGGSVGGSVEVG